MHNRLTMSDRSWYLVAGLLVLVQAAILLYLGRVAICECGTIKLWEGVVQSSGNSQHLSDWYSFSHIIHGFIFYWLLYLVFPKMPFAKRLVLAIGVEAGWEILENSPIIIERYRAATISLMYYGDSVLNSVSDTVMMIVGFFLARKLPTAVTIALLLAMELVVGYLIHDNLLLNIVMLAYPFPAILEWQSAI